MPYPGELACMLIDLHLGIWTNKQQVNSIFVCSFILRAAFWLKVWQPVATYFCLPGLYSSIPQCPWHLPFALGQLDNLSFFIQINDMLGALDFTGS